MTATAEPRCPRRRRLLALLAGFGAGLWATASRAGSGPAAFRLPQWPHGGALPDFELTDQDGRARTLADYRGRLVVVFFGFVHCPDVCPAALYRLALAMRTLGPLRADVQVLFVTLDPERDTAAALGPYVRAFDARFVGLTGSVEQVDAAASRFFVQYARVRRGADYAVDHSTLLYVIDRTGRLRLLGRSDGPTDDLLHDLKVLADEAPAKP